MRICQVQRFFCLICFCFLFPHRCILWSAGIDGAAFVWQDFWWKGLHNSPCDTTAISNPAKKSYCCSGICNYQLAFQTLFQHTELEHTPKSRNQQFISIYEGIALPSGNLRHATTWVQMIPIRCQETSRLTMSHVCIFISSMMLNLTFYFNDMIAVYPLWNILTTKKGFFFSETNSWFSP